jgi:hypothetical protein
MIAFNIQIYVPSKLPSLNIRTWFFASSHPKCSQLPWKVPPNTSSIRSAAMFITVTWFQKRYSPQITCLNCVLTNHYTNLNIPTGAPWYNVKIRLNRNRLAFSTSNMHWFKFEVKLRPTVSRPVCLGVRHPSGTRDQFFFLLGIFFRQLRVCFVAPTLTRRRGLYFTVQLLPGFTRAITLGSKYRRTHGHIIVSHLRLPHPGGPGPCIYIPQEQGGLVINPGTGFQFCSLLRPARHGWRYSNPPPHGTHALIRYQKSKFLPALASTVRFHSPSKLMTKS